MNMVMMFSVDNVREFLLKNGIVFTFRLHKHKTGKDWINKGRGQRKICDVQISLEKEVNEPADLVPYVEYSGFEHLWDWVSEIKKLNPKMNKFHGYLYRVEVIPS